MQALPTLAHCSAACRRRKCLCLGAYFTRHRNARDYLIRRASKSVIKSQKKQARSQRCVALRCSRAIVGRSMMINARQGASLAAVVVFTAGLSAGAFSQTAEELKNDHLTPGDVLVY